MTLRRSLAGRLWTLARWSAHRGYAREVRLVASGRLGARELDARVLALLLTTTLAGLVAAALDPASVAAGGDPLTREWFTALAEQTRRDATQPNPKE